MKKAGKIILLLLTMFVLLAAGAYASAEPSAEMTNAADQADTMEVTIRLNGDAYQTVKVEAAEEAGAYTFRTSDFFEALGLHLSYDEETAIATVTADPGSLMSVLLSEMAAEDPEPTSADNASIAEADRTPTTRKLGVVTLTHDGTPSAADRRMEKIHDIKYDLKERANLDRALLSLPSKDQK